MPKNRRATSRVVARLSWAAWDATIALAVWLVLTPLELVLMLLGRHRPETLRQRLGHVTPKESATGAVLVHAVSVGEMAAAGALLRALTRADPSATFIITTGNRAGELAGQALQRELRAVRKVLLLPWDRRAAMRSWLASLAPGAVVVVETEIWPNLFRACADLGIPLLIASGRIYPRDVHRYRLVRPFFSQVLAAATWIGVQSDAERTAFLDIGAPLHRVQVLGNLKYDVSPPSDALDEGWRDALAACQPLIVAGSTHHPEEAMLLACMAALRHSFPGVRLVLAPRQPHRWRRIVREARRRRLATARLSQPAAAGEPWDVLVVDRLGALAGLYSFADIVFVGGSLADRGGHNPIEAAAAARAIVMGSSTEHFREVVADLQRVDAIRIVPAAGDGCAPLCQVLGELLADPSGCGAMGERAARYWRGRQGIADRHARMVLDAIAARCS